MSTPPFRSSSSGSSTQRAASPRTKLDTNSHYPDQEQTRSAWSIQLAHAQPGWERKFIEAACRGVEWVCKPPEFPVRYRLRVYCILQHWLDNFKDEVDRETLHQCCFGVWMVCVSIARPAGDAITVHPAEWQDMVCIRIRICRGRGTFQLQTLTAIEWVNGSRRRTNIAQEAAGATEQG